MFEIFDIMFEVSALSLLIASISVVIGVIFAYLELRNLVRQRKTELLHGVFSGINRLEFLECWEKFYERESMGLEDYKKKYGLVEWHMVFGVFTEIGFLMSEKLIDADSVYKVFGRAIRLSWEKIKPIMEEVKKRDPQEVWALEYLYNEMQKREQRLRRTQQ